LNFIIIIIIKNTNKQITSKPENKSKTKMQAAYIKQNEFARQAYATFTDYYDAQACALEYAYKDSKQMIQMSLGQDRIEIFKINEELYNIVMNIFTEKGSENETNLQIVHTIYQYPEMTFQDIFHYICSKMLLPHYNENDEFEFVLTYHEYEDMLLFVTSKEFMKYSLNELPLSQGEIVLKDKKKKECGSCEFVSHSISQRCGGCKEVYYCDETCQSLDWSRHKNFCYPTF
jgi:hypothetical protein